MSDTAFHIVRSQQNDGESFTFFTGAIEGLSEGDVVKMERDLGELGRDEEFKVLNISRINHPDASHRLSCQRVFKPLENEVEFWIDAGRKFVVVSKTIGAG